ncbi:MAG: D-amino acid dehydrogenase [Pseudomonadota bacterium]
MKIVILGSGVIGVSTAYYLASTGHQVTVIDRQAGAGLETSFANAGEISPGYSAPWAAPGLPLKAIKWLFMHHRPLVIRPNLDIAMALWGLALLRNCTAARYERNKSRMLTLAQYSRACLEQLRADTGIQYDQRMRGTLQLFRTQKQLDGTAADIAVLKRFDVGYELLDRAGCIAAEPALAHVPEKIVGGLRLTGDETGDCFMFTKALSALAQQRGVQFLFGHTVTALEQGPLGITSVRLTGPAGATRVGGDAFVIALGSYSPLLARQLGLRLPVYPVKGYSLTLPIEDESGAPQSTVMDETFKVAVTRLGNRVRVGGTAELAGYNLKLREPRRQTLNHVVTDLFPHAGDVSKASFWTGLRPMTPDGPPIIGKSKIANLWFNTGHGTLGWTMAAGSGRLMADLIGGRAPEIAY